MVNKTVEKKVFNPSHEAIANNGGDFPEMLVVSTSNVCNSRCVACPFTYMSINEKLSKHGPEKYMSKELFGKICDEAKHYSTLICITGRGEPFLNPDMTEMVEYSKKCNLKTRIITNGSFIDEGIQQRLLNAGVEMIEFSVDAKDEQTYEKVRSGLDFKTVLKNIKGVVEKREKGHYSTKILVSVIDQKEFNDDVDGTIKFWEGIVDIVQRRVFLSYGRVPEGKNRTDPFLNKRGTCVCPFERLPISPNGNVGWCIEDVDAISNVGNVKIQSIREIWTSDIMLQYRNLLKQGRYGEIPLCRECTDWPYHSVDYNYWTMTSDIFEQ